MQYHVVDLSREDWSLEVVAWASTRREPIPLLTQRYIYIARRFYELDASLKGSYLEGFPTLLIIIMCVCVCAHARVLWIN